MENGIDNDNSRAAVVTPAARLYERKIEILLLMMSELIMTIWLSSSILSYAHLLSLLFLLEVILLSNMKDLCIQHLHSIRRYGISLECPASLALWFERHSEKQEGRFADLVLSNCKSLLLRYSHNPTIRECFC
jgi:hypothetical protein